MALGRFNINYLKYGCADKDDYFIVRGQRDQFNYRVWRNVSAIACCYFLILFLTTFSVDIVHPNAVVDAVMFVETLIATVLFRTKIKPGNRFLMPLVYITCFFLFIFGIMIGVFLSVEYLAVTYHVFLIALPLMISDCPYRMGILEMATTGFFVAACVVMKTGSTQSLDIYNAFFFAMLGQFVNYYMATTKIQQFLALHKIEVSSYTDDLTGMKNRKAYENNMASIGEKKLRPNMVYVAMDVNGLKNANDNLGHAAGDELLQGAADCIRRCFGSNGETYRIGGDEFVAIIYASDDECERIKADFQNVLSTWKGELVGGISIAAGYVTAEEFPEKSIVEISKIADQRMYDEKTRYYEMAGIDRRKH